MLGTKSRQQRRRTTLPTEMLQAVEAHMVRSRGLRIDTGRLEPDAQRRLIELWQRETRERTGDEQALTAREEKTYEKLIEVGAGLEPGHLKREREKANRLAEVQRVAREALAVTPTHRQEARFFAEIVKQQRHEGGPCLHAESAGMLLLITTALLSGEGPGGVTFKLDDDGQRCLSWRPGHVFGLADGQNATAPPTNARTPPAQPVAVPQRERRDALGYVRAALAAHLRTRRRREVTGPRRKPVDVPEPEPVGPLSPKLASMRAEPKVEPVDVATLRREVRAVMKQVERDRVFADVYHLTTSRKARERVEAQYAKIAGRPPRRLAPLPPVGKPGNSGLLRFAIQDVAPTVLTAGGWAEGHPVIRVTSNAIRATPSMTGSAKASPARSQARSRRRKGGTGRRSAQADSSAQGV
jgi:hypothetical protein